jgi:hypothetical protein
MTDANVRGGLPLTVWYSFRDDEEGHFGMVDRQGRRKLAYHLPRLLPLAATAAPEAPSTAPARAVAAPERCRRPPP